MPTTKKDHPENTAAGKKAKADAEQADSKVADAAAEQVSESLEKGFRGVEVDPTPNEHYTVTGVTGGKPTPETDEASAEKARKARVEADRLAAGVAGR